MDGTQVAPIWGHMTAAAMLAYATYQQLLVNRLKTFTSLKPLPGLGMQADVSPFRVHMSPFRG